MNVRNELRQLGLKPVKGQHFLTSEPVIDALVESGEVEHEKVLEIGAGTGAITQKLAEKAEKVYAVEKDRQLFKHLKDKFSEAGNVEVIEGDALEEEIPGYTRCVSNLPFQLSSDVLEFLGEKQVQSSLIVQKDFAEKIVAEPGSKKYGYRTVVANYYFVPVKLRDVSRRSYHPRPEVETSILKLYPNKQRHGVEDEQLFFEVVKALFTHDRKKVRNAFVDARHMLEIDKDEAKEVRDELPHSEERVVDLDVKKLSEVTEKFRDLN
ncbi:MAG: 16S rRNA (adenine(1518)-N(6)/adenine(1519)-N(6))-dimethyltransferase RsmA [Candidatus Nanohaloarchaea archaeon]